VPYPAPPSDGDCFVLSAILFHSSSARMALSSAILWDEYTFCDFEVQSCHIYPAKYRESMNIDQRRLYLRQPFSEQLQFITARIPSVEQTDEKHKFCCICINHSHLGGHLFPQSLSTASFQPSSRTEISSGNQTLIPSRVEIHPIHIIGLITGHTQRPPTPHFHEEKS
jgi:hypothetical protein